MRRERTCGGQRSLLTEKKKGKGKNRYRFSRALMGRICGHVSPPGRRAGARRREDEELVRECGVRVVHSPRGRAGLLQPTRGARTCSARRVFFFLLFFWRVVLGLCVGLSARRRASACVWGVSLLLEREKGGKKKK